jgi:hypothetical protein
MISLSVVLILLSTVRAIPDFATGSYITAPTATTGKTSINCQGALRSKFAYVSSDFYKEYATTTLREGALANNYYCALYDNTQCSGAYKVGTSTIKDGYVLGSVFTNKNLALAACP